MYTPYEHPREQTAPAVGTLAPDFTLPDESGKPHRLSEQLCAGKPVVLVFMRGEWWTWCNHQLGQLVEHRQELESRASVWIINPQDVGATHRFKEKRGAPFVFLADENLDVVNLYGIYHTKHEKHGHIPYPVTFVIRPDGTIAWRYLGLKPRDRPKVEDVIKALDQI